MTEEKKNRIDPVSLEAVAAVLETRRAKSSSALERCASADEMRLLQGELRMYRYLRRDFGLDKKAVEEPKEKKETVDDAI